MRAERAFHAWESGSKTSFCAASRATAAMAITAKTCWRFSILMGGCLSPLKVERELQGRATAKRTDLDVRDFFGGAQLFKHLQKRRRVAGGARAGGGGEIANLERPGGNDA